MRMHRLELEGFGPFRTRQTVDFDQFADTGIFLISGRTGAGKSSILDGIVFALYGAVPRYEDAVSPRLRSDHCAPGDPTRVRLEFTASGRRWRVTRAPGYERPKKNRPGTTTEQPRAEVDEYVDGAWIGRAAKPRDAAMVLAGILGLSRTEFLQVVLLAQGRFAQFLLAKNEERQALLRTLFSTRVYAEMEDDLEDRRRKAHAAIDQQMQTIRAILDEASGVADALTDGTPALAAADTAIAEDTPARLARLDVAAATGRDRITQARTRQQEAEEVRDRAAAAHHRLRDLHTHTASRQAARVRLAGLLSDTDQITAARSELSAATRADTVRAALDATTRAHHRAATAQAATTTARTDADRHGIPPTADTTALAGLLETLDGTIAIITQARELEHRLTDLEQQLTDARQQLADARREGTALADRRDTLPALRSALQDRIDSEGARAATLPDAQRDHTRAQQILAAALEVPGLAAAADRAGRDRLAAATALQEAAQHATTLLHRRIQDRAGELAQGLAEGTPCPVCGSRTHPAPATPTTGPVTDETLTAAENARRAAQETAQEAADAATAAETALAAATTRADGHDPHTAQQAADQAAARVHAAQHATDTLHDLTTERTQLREETDRIDASLEQARHRQTEAERTVTALAEQITATTRTITAARGTHPTVTAHLNTLTGRRTAAATLKDALADQAGADQTLRDATTDLDERLAAAGFPTPDSAAAALRDQETQRQLGDRIRTHEADFAAVRAQLETLDGLLAGAPVPLPPLEDSAAAVDTARTASDELAAQTATLQAAARSLDRLRGRAGNAYAAVDGLEQRHQLVAGVANAVAGRNDHKMDLETFVLAAQLEQIVAAANLRLDDMSAGRYQLRHTDARTARRGARGLGLQIIDSYTGRARPTESLSGGETFLASLALALGLAEVVTARAGGLHLDTLFIDEGFGGLDPETLDLAMRTLDDLRAGGRTIGVISHVAEMKEQIPAQLAVTVTTGGDSTIHSTHAA